jgi:hypothetical protein
LVPILSLITASDAGTGWTYKFLNQAFEVAGVQTRMARLTLASTTTGQAKQGPASSASI